MRAIALLALLAAPAAGQLSIPHTTFQLANGLRVVVNEDRSTPIVSVNVWYHVGSGYEKPGRTGFAHLFEHVMFEGSKHVKEGEFDDLLERVGGVNNGSTTPDRTNYFETVPSNSLELALWLEADRMGSLLETLTAGKLDNQRDIVKNERRQRYENQPYGLLFPTIFESAYPKSHPYSWPTIGSMEDLSAASLDDVKEFFRTYYVPNNAVLAISGDVSARAVRPLVERYFGWIPRGAPVARPRIPVPQIAETRFVTKEDRVTLPQVTVVWRTSPRFSRDEAPLDILSSILTDGKTSRLYKRLVYDAQIAQTVSASNYAQLLSGDMLLTVRGRQNVDLDTLHAAVLEEVAKIAATPPSAEEVKRAINGYQTSFFGGLETVQGKADQLNSYLYYAGDPGYLARDLQRYRDVTPADVQRVAREYLHGRNRVVISFVPAGKTELAVAERKETR